MANLSLRNINKIYDNKVQAVFDFSLEIEDKEFIVLVGPSGCGKSTTLRMIAGLEEISSGELWIDNQKMNDVMAKDRSIAMVFQSYALYPHMTVYDNMAFGLSLHKMSKEEIKQRVLYAAEILEITPYLKRKPKALSGGQCQRVALGRAIVRNAKVFLMDEPLSNLDAKLRLAMRTEIIKLHKNIGTTTVYVTHDQTEAMTMATRIVVMKEGYIQQMGTPRQIYNHPANMFVASFIGAPAMNFLKGHCISGQQVEIEGQSFPIPAMFNDALQPYVGKEIILGIRPEDIRSENGKENLLLEPIFQFKVEVSELLGHEFILHGTLGVQTLEVKIASRMDVLPSEVMQLTMDSEKMHFFDCETQKAIA